jgi:hypothetical protein
MTVPSRDDAEELGRVVRDFLAKWSSEVKVRRLMATDVGLDPHVWARMAELGLPGLVVPEPFGGGGATAIELGGVFEELGAALYAGPFFATVGLAATALLAAGDEDASARHLPGIAAGTTTATLAWAGEKPAASPLLADRRPDRHARTRGHALHDADDDRVHAVQVVDDAVQALCEVVDELLAVVRGGEATHVAPTLKIRPSLRSRTTRASSARARRTAPNSSATISWFSGCPCRRLRG